jgi:hypothetical protein
MGEKEKKAKNPLEKKIKKQDQPQARERIRVRRMQARAGELRVSPPKSRMQQKR